MGATALINGVNGLSISTDLQYHDGPTNYASSNGFSNTPSSVRSDSPSQMSSSTVGNNSSLDPQQVLPPVPRSFSPPGYSHIIPHHFISFTKHDSDSKLPSLEQHIEENAITNARFADVTIHLANFSPIPAHAIFLSRSPYLNNLLNNQPPSPPYTINLPTLDPNLTLDAIRTALHILYTPVPLPATPPAPTTIISHIAAACVLGIYPVPLVELYRSILLQQNFHPSTILQFTTFLLSAPHPITPAEAHPGPYPPFTTGLLANVISYFLTTLPLHLSSSASAALPPSAASEDYKAMLVPLPFDLLKHLLEHPALPISGEKARYELAKQVVAKRAARDKQLRRRSEDKGTPLGPPVEESVILKVGGKDGGGVQIVRSLGRRRGLWKATSSGNVGEGRRSRNSAAGSK